MLPYRDLLVWQKAHALAMSVLEISDRAPLANLFWFRDQLCSCAMSVPANIAEGSGRGTDIDFASFLDRARGSLFELDTWLITANARGYITGREADALAAAIGEVNAMLFALRRTLRADRGRRE